MTQYSAEPRTRKNVKRYGFLSFARKYKKQLLNAELDFLKTTSKKVHKSCEFLWNKIADAVAKSKDHKIVKTETVEKMVFYQKKWNITKHQNY